jgi:lipoprotein-releasing system permease protein
LFRAVHLEKRMMFLLLFLIVTVAIFNIVASQTMVVNEKRADIAILRTMGASAGFIMKVFLLQGVVISIIGIAFGLALGISLALNISDIVEFIERLAGISMLEGTYFETLPSHIEKLDLYAITSMAFFLCVASAIGPARRAAHLNPVESLG